jgi:hypothetical protein
VSEGGRRSWAVLSLKARDVSLARPRLVNGGKRSSD